MRACVPCLHTVRAGIAHTFAHACSEPSRARSRGRITVIMCDECACSLPVSHRRVSRAALRTHVSAHVHIYKRIARTFVGKRARGRAEMPTKCQRNIRKANEHYLAIIPCTASFRRKVERNRIACPEQSTLTCQSLLTTSSSAVSSHRHRRSPFPTRKGGSSVPGPGHDCKRRRLLQTHHTPCIALDRLSASQHVSARRLLPATCPSPLTEPGASLRWLCSSLVPALPTLRRVCISQQVPALVDSAAWSNPTLLSPLTCRLTNRSLHASS